MPPRMSIDYGANTPNANQQNEDMEPTESALLKVIGITMWWGSGWILNGCATAFESASHHDSQLAVLSRVGGILSSFTVFIYTAWKLWKMWKNNKESE